MNCQQKHLYLCPAQSQTNQFHSSRYCCRGEKSKQWIMIFYVNLFRHKYKIRNKASENVFEAAIFFLLSAGRGFYALATNDQIRTKAKLANTKQEKMPHKSGDQSRGKKYYIHKPNFIDYMKNKIFFFSYVWLSRLEHLSNSIFFSRLNATLSFLLRVCLCKGFPIFITRWNHKKKKSKLSKAVKKSKHNKHNEWL